MITKIKFAFVIGTRNRGGLLSVTLQNLCMHIESAHADFPDFVFEIVVSDNASSDETQDVLQRFSRQFDYIKYTAQDANVGPFCNYRAAANLTDADYVWVFGDDDILLPTALAGIVARFRLRSAATLPSLILVDFVHFESEAQAYERPRESPAMLVDRCFPSRGDLFNHVTFAGAGFLSRIIIKKKYWLEGLQDAKSVDWRIWLQVKSLILAAAAGETLVCSQTCVAQRVFAKGNRNWYGAATITNSIEFPSLAAFAITAGFDPANVDRAYSRRAAVTAYFKLCVNESYFGKVVSSSASDAICAAGIMRKSHLGVLSFLARRLRLVISRVLAISGPERTALQSYVSIVREQKSPVVQ